ncbi:MAG TPA: hypothetical protein VN203_22345, partial [Candidatus Acidoferrum sp.]|nr:hypothetical protein [Candidatus Acidoferrum sp.]
FTPNLSSPAIYKLLVQNIGNSPTAGTVVASDTFNLGVRATAIQASNWSCDSVPSQGTQTVSCTRSDSLAPGQSYDPILISVAIDANACPSATDRPLLTLSDKTQNIPSIDSIPLRGCITQSPTTVSFSPVHLGNSGEVPASQTLTLIANDKQDLKITIHPLPSSSAFSLSSASCKNPSGQDLLASGQDCTVVLSQGSGIALTVSYNPACIGSHKDSISFSTDIPGSQPQSLPLTGQTILQSLSFVLAPGGQSLDNSTVQPATSADIGLNASPGFCIPGASSTVTPSILPIGAGSVFQGKYDSQSVQYDQMIVACPSGTAGCVGTIKTGTVAGLLS